MWKPQHFTAEKTTTKMLLPRRRWKIIWVLYLCCFLATYLVLRNSLGDVTGENTGILRDNPHKQRINANHSVALESKTKIKNMDEKEKAEGVDVRETEDKEQVAEDGAFLEVMKSLPYLPGLSQVHFAPKVNLTTKEVRMQELMDSIGYTLTHPLVKHVYIFYKDPLLVPYMQKQNLPHKHKLVFKQDLNDTIGNMFRYANEHLKGSVVMVMNADVYPVEGFELIDLEKFKKANVSYTISRWGRKEKNCDLTEKRYSNQCTKAWFVGSMDAYVYSPKKHFSADSYRVLSHEPHHYGIENLTAWVLRREGFRILNPCLVLRVYHNHCGIHTKAGHRVNMGRSAQATPTEKLF